MSIQIFRAAGDGRHWVTSGSLVGTCCERSSPQKHTEHHGRMWASVHQLRVDGRGCGGCSQPRGEATARHVVSITTSSF